MKCRVGASDELDFWRIALVTIPQSIERNIVTEQDLKNAGYHTYLPKERMGDLWRIAYQKCFRKNGVKQYFIDVHIYPLFGKYSHGGMQIELNVNDGCSFYSGAMKIQLFAFDNAMTVDQMEAIAYQIHNRLETIPYEKE